MQISLQTADRGTFFCVSHRLTFQPEGVKDRAMDTGMNDTCVRKGRLYDNCRKREGTSWFLGSEFPYV